MLTHCNGCNTEVTAQSINPEFPDRGLVFYFQEGGYYGGFTDNEPWETRSERRITPWKLCHDCVLKILHTLPALAEFLGGGHHPAPGDKPCCEFSWTFQDGVTMYPDGSSWKPKTQ